MVIYMDIHSNMVMRDVVFKWLEYMGFEIILLEIIRASYKRLDSGIKFTLGENNGIISANTILNLLYDLSGETVDNEEKKYPIIRIRFEDLKLYPRQILKKLCNILGIQWNDIFLETTFAGKESVYISNGERITGFYLKPVYHTYDEYFDAFDKFRLDLIFRKKNKAYNYSYTDRNKYPPLEEIGKLFSFPFSIEKYISFNNEKDKIKFRNKIGFLCIQLLILEESIGKYAGHFQFGPYLALEDGIW